MAENVNISKRRLENTPMHVYHVRGGASKKIFMIDLKIHNFSQLKDNTPYCLDAVDFDLNVSVTKKRRSIVIGLISEHYGGIDKSYVDNGDGYSPPIYPERRARFFYETEIPTNVFNTPRNMLLKKGTLGIAFKSKPVGQLVEKVRSLRECKNYRIDDGIHPGTSRKRTDQEELANDLKDYFWSKPRWDLVLYSSKGVAFQVHRSILAARSNFFLDYINKNAGKEQITLSDVTHYTLNIVLQYLYHGEIEVFELGVMLEVLESAVSLQIPGLEKLCIMYLRGVIDLNNFDRIRKVGEKLGLEVLVKACKYFEEGRIP